MKEYKWRTPKQSSEGTKVRFVDSQTGSDLFGDGTRTNPFQSLGKAYRGCGSKPTKIICRGRFSEMMADGDHSCYIDGDYYGAAVFDGADTYLLYGFKHNNLIVLNTGVGTYDLPVYTGSEALAGVGSANGASAVGGATYVSGVAGSPVLLDRTSLYMGIVGGTTACKYNVYSRMKNNGTYLIALGGYQFGLSHSTVYGVQIKDRCKSPCSNVPIYSTIFANFAMIANETGTIKYTGCLFAVDARWYYLTEKEGNTGEVTEFVLTGKTSAERQESLLTQLRLKYEDLGIPESARKYPTFTDCLFSTQTSEELFNNPEHLDFTLRPDSDGVINNYLYYGALPPGVNVPIMDDSTGVPATWDEKTVSGCLAVTGNKICLDETSPSMAGEILSKVLTIDPSRYPLAGIFAAYVPKFTEYHSYLNERAVTGKLYNPGEMLPTGHYIVKGAVVYNFTQAAESKDVNIGNNNIVVVSEENTTFANDNISSQLLAIDEPNITDVIYCRCRAMIYFHVKASDGLQRGGTYINDGDEVITYHGRNISPNESFVAVNSEETFTASTPEYTIGVLFDDTRVPASEWIPAQMFGEYFVMKESGVIKLDEDGVPVSSGNYRAFQTTANGGYSDQLRKSIMNQKYVQFKIKLSQYDHLG